MRVRAFIRPSLILMIGLLGGWNTATWMHTAALKDAARAVSEARWIIAACIESRPDIYREIQLRRSR